MGALVSARRPFVLVPQWFGSIVFERATARYLPFDHEITALLRASTRVAIDVACEDPGRRERLHAFLEEHYPRGMFTVDLRFDGDVLDLDPPEGMLSAPLVTHLEVNAVCNIACVHCFAGALPRKERPLALDELDALFADMAAMGALRLALSGGEPLLRKDLYELIDLAIARGLRTSLVTNGLLLDERHVNALAKRDLLWLSVSLDGATAAVNDAIRGEGTFDAVLERVALLRGRVPFSLAMTVTSTNYQEAAAFNDLARRVGASGAVLRPMYPAGMGRARAELVPTFAQYRAALAALDDAADRATSCDALTSHETYGPQHRSATDASVIAHLGCGAGTTLAAISSSGVVSPCSFLGDDFDGPSIRDEPLSSIWRRAPTFARLRSPEAAASFRGGCRARSLVFAGSAFAPDPWLSSAEDRRFDPLVTLRVQRSR